MEKEMQYVTERQNNICVYVLVVDQLTVSN